MSFKLHHTQQLVTHFFANLALNLSPNSLTIDTLDKQQHGEQSQHTNHDHMVQSFRQDNSKLNNQRSLH